MLNRHAIVLFLGNAAMLLLHPPPTQAVAPLGGWFLLLLVGLLLDTGEVGPRTTLAHGLQLAGIVLLGVDVALLVPEGRTTLPVILGELGISLAALGVLVEMRAPYGALRAGVTAQVLGDGLFTGAFVLALLHRPVPPSTTGWVFIGIAGLVSLYAALSNLALQVARLVNPQAGWRFKVTALADDALTLKTPHGVATVEWKHVRALKRLDARHVLLVLPSPLPPEIARVGLPLEELRQSAEAPPPGVAVPPDAFGFVLHEQELGQPLEAAERLLEAHVGH
jgi:hypothetical protein